MAKCKIDPTHETDDYGCLECFSQWCLEEAIKEMEKDEEK